MVRSPVRTELSASQMSWCLKHFSLLRKQFQKAVRRWNLKTADTINFGGPVQVSQWRITGYHVQYGTVGAHIFFCTMFSGQSQLEIHGQRAAHDYGKSSLNLVFCWCWPVLQFDRWWNWKYSKDLAFSGIIHERKQIRVLEWICKFMTRLDVKKFETLADFVQAFALFNSITLGEREWCTKIVPEGQGLCAHVWTNS